MLINFNHLQTFYSALKQKLKSYRGNWEQNNPEADDYIKNRPFYSEIGKSVILPETTIDLSNATAELKQLLVEGQTYKVVWNGVAYECVARNYDGYLMLGNNAIYEYDNGINTDTGEPFAMETENDSLFLDVYTNDAESPTLSISTYGEIVHQIDKKYVPVPNNIITSNDFYDELDNLYDDIGYLINNTVENYALLDQVSVLDDEYFVVENQIVWDGVTTGLEYVKTTDGYMNGMNFSGSTTVSMINLYKVSDDIYDIDELSNSFSKVKYTTSGNVSTESKIHKDDSELYYASEDGESVIWCDNGLILIAKKPGTFTLMPNQNFQTKTVVIPSAGLYFGINIAVNNRSRLYSAKLARRKYQAKSKHPKLILPSYTDGSENTFVITVDDTGIMSVSDENGVACSKTMNLTDVSGQIETHNTSTTAHTDIREAIAANASAIELLTNGAMSADAVSGIIDVVELPTEDINENVLYRKLSAVFVYDQYIRDLDKFVCHCVETLPETGEVVSQDMQSITAYYNVQDGVAYGYINDALSAYASIPVGWYPLATLAPSFGTAWGGIITDINDDPCDDANRILLQYELYSYKNTWIKLEHIGRSGSNVCAEVFNSLNNIADGKYSHAEGGSTHAQGTSSHAEGAGTYAIGDCSHAEGGNTHAQGVYSHAEGVRTYAMGEASHAEGRQSIAQGEYSHAEGFESYAQGTSSHAEGYYTHAEGDGSHVEGWKSYAQGDYSHAEGFGTRAIGKASHAEGNGELSEVYITGDADSTIYTSNHTYGLYVGAYIKCIFNDGSGNQTHNFAKIIEIDKANNIVIVDKTLSNVALDSKQATVYSAGFALGDYSHSEGNSTIAIGHSQHVQGSYNIVDDDGKYAHIVGNGRFNDSRSNAHTLDWNGWGWFAGGLKVGGTGQDDENAKEVALKEDIEDIANTISDYHTSLGGYEVVLSHDGNRNGKITYMMMAHSYTRVGDKIDPDTVVNISMIYNGERVSFVADDLLVTKQENVGIKIEADGHACVYILDEEDGFVSGTYVSSNLEEATYVTEVKMIIPISSKFIPDAIPKVESAEIGQILIVNAVDENGKPTEWDTTSRGYDNKKTFDMSDLGDSELRLSLEQIIGAKVDLELPEDGCYFLQTPKRIPDEQFMQAFEYHGGMFVISYIDFDGMLTKNGFGFSNFHVCCPTFKLNYPEYTMVAYMPEEASDTMGLGITLQPGWYAVNPNTFAFETFDLANNPVIVNAEIFENLEKYEDKEVVAFIRDSLFVKKYSHSFIVREKNVAISTDGGYRSVVISFADINSGVGSTDETWAMTSLWVGDENDSDGLFNMHRSPYQDAHGKLTYVDGVTPIDPKYLPEEAYPKRIELRNYTFENGVPLEQIILLAYQNGGGRVHAPLDNKFWSDIDTNRHLRLIMYTDLAGAKGGAIEIDGCTVLRMNGVLMQVSCEAVFNFNGNYTRLRITIARDTSNDTTVAVSVEAIAWPDLVM